MESSTSKPMEVDLKSVMGFSPPSESSESQSHTIPTPEADYARIISDNKKVLDSKDEEIKRLKAMNSELNSSLLKYQQDLVRRSEGIPQEPSHEDWYARRMDAFVYGVGCGLHAMPFSREKRAQAEELARVYVNRYFHRME